MQQAISISEQVSLQPYNTFGLEATAALFVRVQSLPELTEALRYARSRNLPYLLLGGGSNVLLTRDPEGLVILIDLKGIEVLAEDESTVLVRAMAGENWHSFVMHCLAQGWGGLENLSLIPGTVGAAPMQNIGAYGVEIKDSFVSLEAIRTSNGKRVQFDAEDCQFGYRWSRFKGVDKGRYAICSVAFRLSKGKHALKLDYGAIRETLSAKGLSSPTIHDVSNAVIHIRQSKLPDPAQIGNAGSFFKNPSIATARYAELKEKYPTMPGYPQGTDLVKVPAGWLIDQAGWKGHLRGQIGVHKLQALVLVNYGEGKGAAIKELAADIQADIRARYGISLEPEVNFI